MKKSMTSMAVAAALLISGGAYAAPGDMFIDVGPGYDQGAPIPLGTGDADTTTGIFNEFGFNQLKATSFYNVSDGSIFGDFFDTNIASQISAFAGLPGNNLPTLSGGTTDIEVPAFPGANTDIDALSPLIPPLVGSDSEGFLGSWDLQVQYNFQGTLTAAGPVYTGGFFDLWFNDLSNDANDRVVLTGELTGSQIGGVNLDLFFDITFAEDGFLFVEDQDGNFIDANDLAGIPSQLVLALDTNVDPPIPTNDQLVSTSGPLNGTGANTPYVVRQTNLDGSITAAVVPVPGTLAILGLGLAALAGSVRRMRRA